MKPELKVLYADDGEESMTKIIKLNISNAFPDYEIKMERVYNGKDLVTNVENKLMSIPYQFLVSDHEMPFLNGFNALLELQRKGIKTPAIIITGGCVEELEPKMSQLERTTILGKPFTSTEFKERLRAIAPEYAPKF